MRGIRHGKEHQPAGGSQVDDGGTRDTHRTGLREGGARTHAGKLRVNGKLTHPRTCVSGIGLARDGPK